MTTALDKAQPAALVKYADDGQPVLPPDRRPRRLGRWFANNPAWPLTAMMVLWPLWWVLGIGEYTPVLFAIPMIRRMYQWHTSGRRRLRMPPGFILWALFMFICVVSLATISQTAPGTLASPVSNRLIAWGLRTASYVAATAILLYAGNLTEKEAPRRFLAWLLGLVGIYTVIGGLAGTLLPNIQITSPLAMIVPNSIQANNSELQLMLHPSVSEVMNFLGYAEGRPTAPFTYTNMWGSVLATLLPWVLVAWWLYAKTRRQRLFGGLMMVIALVPVVYSLDRGLWLGIGFSVVYIAVRSAARGKLALLGWVCGALALIALVIFLSPLQSLISQRLAHGASDQARATGSSIAVQDALASPIIGWGDTRHQIGSAQSIAIGRSASCQSCGGTSVGGNGQLQLMLICSGFGGAGLYVAFFCYGIWHYRRDRSAYGMAGVLVLLIWFVFMFVYEAVGPPLAFIMIVYAILWRNERARNESLPADTRADGHAAPVNVGSRRAITAGPGA